MLVVLAMLVASVFASGSAHADLGKQLPNGYVSTHIGKVQWTYPVSATSETRDLQAAEPAAFSRVVHELGVVVAADLDIRIAVNPQQMQSLAPDGLPLPDYADGIAFPERGLILLTLTEPQTWLRPNMKAVLTHELSHVALYRSTGGAAVPRWFSEGVALHQAGESAFSRLHTLWEATLRGRLIPLDRLAASFPSRHGEVDLAYAQSADFVGFMLGGTDERARFRELLRALARGTPFADALTHAYHVPLGYMERDWRATLTQRFGRWPALLMGLTFVWVLGAVLLVVGYIRTRGRHKATLRRWAIEEAPLAQPPAVVPPPLPVTPAQSNIDEFFDKRAKGDSGIPTVVHDGQSHTLH